MKKDFYLLKGTVSKLKKGEKDEQTLLLISSILAFFSYLFKSRPLLKGKYFTCYVGNHAVEGRVSRIAFEEGDYVEMLVKPPQDYDTYQCYAIRVPAQHMLIFPRYIGMSTCEFLKINFILTTVMVVICCLLFLIISLCNDSPLSYLINIIKYSFWGWIFGIIFIFFAAGGGYSFFGNQVLAYWGYPKPWRHSVADETIRFKKLYRAGASDIFNDPQTPEFKPLAQFKGECDYYCKTPTLPNWLPIID